jgi:hypothetical protein
VISIQLACALADQEHSRATLTFTSPLPPDELKLDDELAIETWQRAAVGPVTLVTAELPHAAVIIIIAATTYGRARERIFTRNHHTSCAPATIEGA